MDYFGGATRIGTLCCIRLLWAIDLVGKPLWHPTARINCCMDVRLYSQILWGKELAPVLDLDDPNFVSQPSLAPLY